MTFPLDGIMRTPSELDSTLLERRRTLEARRKEAVLAAELIRARRELDAEAKQEA